MATKAPFETFVDFDQRAASEAPYGEAFIAKCREKALEYDKADFAGLRCCLLSDLMQAVPMHYRGRVFDGISFTFVK